jgi:hypothetical protein
MHATSQWEDFSDRCGINSETNPALNAASSTNKRPGMVDAKNRRIDPRARYATGSCDIFLNPLSGHVFCKRIVKDADKSRAALREAADRKIREYAEGYHVSTDVAIHWISVLERKERKIEQERAKAEWEAKSGEKASAVPADDDEEEAVAEPLVELMRSVLPKELWRAAAPIAAYDYRQSALIARKRKETLASTIEASLGDDSSRMKTQSFKGLSAAERKINNKRHCGREPLGRVGLVFNAFYFFGALYFKCPRCRVPAISTFHPSKIVDGTLTCGYCETDNCGRAVDVDEEKNEFVVVRGEAEAAPPPPRRCVLCEPGDRLVADKRLQRHIVWDDDNNAAAHLHEHDFCAAHWFANFTCAGTLLKLSELRAYFEARKK